MNFERPTGSVSSSGASAKAYRRRRTATRLRLPFAVAAALAVLAAYRFHSARDTDSGSTAARMRLVAGFQKQYVPGGESAANHDAAKRALEEIARVLDRDPSNRAAIMAAAEINAGRSDYDRAREWYGRLAAIDSSNADAFAGMSAASLAQVSGSVLEAESRAGLLLVNLGHRSAERKGAHDDLRRSLAAQWSGAVAEGIAAASKALTIDRGHEGAMLTLEAWHHLAADLASSPDAYRQHMTAADEWRHKALEARRLKAERGSQ
jgi:tetratricopeptide (TPR) repeat protein